MRPSWYKKYILREAIEQTPYGEENVEGKKELVVLVGPPGVGKSTYIAKKFPPGEVTVISRDDLADSYSASEGLTYDDLFATPPAGSEEGTTVAGMEKYGNVVKSPPWMTWAPLSFDKIMDINNKINAELKSQFDSIASSDKHVVIDMTNMNANARKNALSSAKDADFFKRAVVFTLADSDLPVLMSRLEQRSADLKSKGKSKTIGPDVIQRMVKSFQAVDPSEGFDKVDKVSTFEPLESSMKESFSPYKRWQVLSGVR